MVSSECKRTPFSFVYSEDNTKRFLFAYSPFYKPWGCWVDTTLSVFAMSLTDALQRASLNTGYNEFAFTLLCVEGV